MSKQQQVDIEIIPIYYKYVLDKNYPVVVLVGGRNSGKSFFMEQLAVVNIHNKSKYKLLVIEDVETNIGEGVKAGIESRAEEFKLDKVITSTKVPPEVKHKLTGNNIIFKGYHSKDQQKQVKSLNEVTAVWYEEAENITYDQFKSLRMQLRGGDAEDRQLFLTLNPINENSFINQEFFQKSPDEILERFPDGRPKVFIKNITVDMDDSDNVVIPCLIVVSVHWDNPYITREQRADIEGYKHTDPEKYAMLAEGKFVKSGGVYFKEFENHIHVVEPFVIPSHWTKYFSMDYGLDMLAGLWFAVDPQNNVYVYKEVHESDLIISEAAKKILEINNGDVIRTWYAPSDLWSRTKDTGKTISGTFLEHGVNLQQSSRDRVRGWLAVKEALKVLDKRDIFTGEPIKTSRLKVFSNCTNLVKNIKQIKRSDKDPNDCATEPHDITHILDALRGYCISFTQFTDVSPIKQTLEDQFFGKKPSNTKAFIDDSINDWG